jgi:hypothetical protein
MDVNPDKLNSFMGKMVGDFGTALNASLMLIGDKLGLYKALAAKGPMNSSELAQATGTSERYVREWLAAQAASGYVEYDTASGKFSMQPENRRFPRLSRPARASAGTGAANACSAAPRASSAPATSTIWCRNGCRRLRVWSKN